MRRKITKEIEEWDLSGSRTALLVSGARQVGKTYSISEYCRERYSHYLRVDFTEEVAVSAFEGNTSVDDIILQLSSVYLDFEFVPGETILFFDEIQLCPNARTSLKLFAMDGRYRVIASESLLGLKIKEVRLPPTGYVDEITMGPMDFEEYLWAIGMSQDVIDSARSSISRCEPMGKALFESFSKHYRSYMVVGGMPEAVAAFVASRQLAPVLRIQRKIVNGYLVDIENYADKSVIPKAESCLRSIPLMLAEESKKFKFSKVTAVDGGDILVEDPMIDEEILFPDGPDDDPKEYYRGFKHCEAGLNWLSMANITLTCRAVTDTRMPLEEHWKINNFKLYMLDTGLLLTFYDRQTVTEIMKGNSEVNRGALAENSVAVALSLQGRHLQFYRNTKEKMEVDFLTVIRGRVCAIEVKSGSDRSCSSLNRLMSSRRLDGIMFETRNCFVDDKGVRHYPMFAASFMDAIDPPQDVEADFSDVEELNRMYSKG